jgi:MFS transporter, ACS family, hexuronate transporter
MNASNRWWVMAIFCLSSSINYMDRQILVAVSPAFKAEFHLNYEQYGQIGAAFGLLYMLSSPLMGWLLDRVGLNLGTSIALTWWSLAGIARGFMQGLPGLVVTHSLVAVGESAGIPSTAKASQTYLKPEERAIGSTISQIGLVVGMTMASFVANYCIAHWGWRSAFFVAGWLGFLWIPLWFWAAKKAPIQPAAPSSIGFNTRSILAEPQTWGFILANVLSLGIFLFWMNFGNHYFVKNHGMSVEAANQLAPVLQAVSLLGSFLGSWGSMQLILRGWQPMSARRRVYLFGAIGMLFSALVPLAPNAATAIGLISISYFASSVASVNLYTMPLEAYGGSRAAFSVSLLTASYGLLNVLALPAIGWVADRHGFSPVCIAIAIPPLLGYFILELTKAKQQDTQPA